MGSLFSSDISDVAWRKTKDLELHKLELMKRLKSYEMFDKDMTHYNILLFGVVGHGKSSVLNTLLSVVLGRISNFQLAGNAAASAQGRNTFTKQFQMHTFKKKKEGAEELKCRYYDMMGIEGTSKLDINDFRSVLDGNVKTGYEFKSAASIENNSPHYRRDPSISDKMHVVAICVAADQIQNNEVSIMLQNYIESIRDRQIPICMLLTKIDLVVKKQESVQKVYNSKTLKLFVEKCAKMFGVTENEVFPVKNYHCEIELEDHIDSMALHVNLQMMNMAHGYMQQCDNTASSFEKNDIRSTN